MTIAIDVTALPALLTVTALGAQVSRPLDPFPGVYGIGRHESNDFIVHHLDVSRYQCQITAGEHDWSLVPSGTASSVTCLARSGATTEVREPVELKDGDSILVGPLSALFQIVSPERRQDRRVDPLKHPVGDYAAVTSREAAIPMSVRVTAGELRVLQAMAAQPLRGRGPMSIPELAGQLFISENGVRGHITGLYRAFEIPEAEFTPAQKQARLLELAVRLGFVTAARPDGSAVVAGEHGPGR